MTNITKCHRKYCLQCSLLIGPYQGGIIILARCKYPFIRVHENLMQHPVIINRLLLELYVNKCNQPNRVRLSWSRGINSRSHTLDRMSFQPSNYHYKRFALTSLYITSFYQKRSFSTISMYVIMSVGFFCILCVVEFL